MKITISMKLKHLILLLSQEDNRFSMDKKFDKITDHYTKPILIQKTL